MDAVDPASNHWLVPVPPEEEPAQSPLGPPQTAYEYRWAMLRRQGPVSLGGKFYAFPCGRIFWALKYVLMAMGYTQGPWQFLAQWEKNCGR